MKICPTCGFESPDGAKFCPEDGYRFPMAAAPQAQPAPTPAPAPVAVQLEEPQTLVQGSSGGPAPFAPTAAELERIASMAAREAGNRPVSKGQYPATADGWGGAGAAEGAAGGFSETAWFRAAVKPEDLPEQADADDLEGRYKRDPSLSEEERAKFSLNRKNPGKGDK